MVIAVPAEWVDEAPVHLSRRATGEARLLVGPVVLIVTLTHKGRCYADAGALVVMEWLRATTLAEAKTEAVELVRERLTAMLAALPPTEERSVSERRAVIVFDGQAWFVRRLVSIKHDLEREHKVYRCDEHIGGPYLTATEAAIVAQKFCAHVR